LDLSRVNIDLPVLYPEHLTGDGQVIVRARRQVGLEGIVSMMRRDLIDLSRGGSVEPTFTAEVEYQNITSEGSGRVLSRDSPK
jgi:hypothetical protein